MSTPNTLFHDKIRKFPYLFVIFSYRNNFVVTINEFELVTVKELSVFKL